MSCRSCSFLRKKSLVTILSLEEISTVIAKPFRSKKETELFLMPTSKFF